MGWRGTVRSFNAACRAAAREEQRRQRAEEKLRRQQEKMQALAYAEFEVEQYREKVEQIVSLHRECSLPIDWEELLNETEPQMPTRDTLNESQAKNRLQSYRPSWWDRLFKLEEKKKGKLSNAIANAIATDERSYREALKAWADEHAKWADNVRIAKGVIDNNPESKAEAIKQFSAFSDLADIGSAVSFSIDDDKVLEIELKVKSQDVVPCEVKSLQRNGRVSTKKMSQTEFNALYQDYVCSAVLRVANETFSLLPDEFVLVTATDKLLNTKNGHLDDMPILSVLMSRTSLGTLNLEKIDPSDSMRNFINRMDFKKTKGFVPVERLTQDEVAARIGQ